MHELYPLWSVTRAWVHDMRKNIAFEERDRTNPFLERDSDFGNILHVVEQVNDQYGEFQDFECRDLIETLLEHESVLGLGILQCQHVRFPAKGKYSILW